MIKKLYSNNGITLISVIVTIIVLLILASVTLNFILNEDGIINKTQLAVNEYKKAEENEKNILNEINNYFKDLDINDEVTNDEKVIDNVKVGDYVKYDPTKNVSDISKLSYTSKVGNTLENGNGKSAQTFTANENIKWVVLNVNKDEEILELISEKPIKTDENKNLFFKGNIGYLYFEEELQKICSIYGYGYGADSNNIVKYYVGNEIDGLEEKEITSGARSLDIKDMNKLANISDTEDSYKELDGEYGKKEELKRIYYPTLKTGLDNGKSENLKTGFRYTYYEYWGEDYIKDAILKNSILNGKYWIASRCVGINNDESLFNVDFCGYCVDASGGEGLIHGMPVCEGNEYRVDQFETEGFGIRPVVKINKNTKIDKSIESDGSVDKPWILK